MPEGHTLHRHARIQTKELGGKTLRVSSPQGWAAEAAAALDGRALQKIDAHGKHLLYRFGDAQALHVHLGLFGRFRSWKGLAPPPRETTRLRFDAGERGVDLSGATASELIDADAEAKLLARLGPDGDAVFRRSSTRHVIGDRWKFPNHVGGQLMSDGFVLRLDQLARLFRYCFGA